MQDQEDRARAAQNRSQQEASTGEGGLGLGVEGFRVLGVQGSGFRCVCVCVLVRGEGGKEGAQARLAGAWNGYVLRCRKPKTLSCCSCNQENLDLQ